MNITAERSPQTWDRNLFNQLTSKVGDLGLKRRVETMLDWFNITSGTNILDCGCGEGFYTMTLSMLYPDINITAFDYNAELLKMASGWVSDKPNVKFQNGNIEEGLPFADNSFDRVIFSEVLEHLNDDKAALKEIFRIVKPGGIVGLTVPNQNYPLFWDPLNGIREGLGLGHFDSKNTILGGVWSYDHKRLYTVDQISSLAEKTGFRILNKVNFTHYCLPFNYLILRLGKIFATSLAPKSIKNATEKFEWNKNEAAKPSIQLRLMTSFFSFMKSVDNKNDAVKTDLSKSSVSIGLKLMKPNA